MVAGVALGALGPVLVHKGPGLTVGANLSSDNSGNRSVVAWCATRLQRHGLVEAEVARNALALIGVLEFAGGAVGTFGASLHRSNSSDFALITLYLVFEKLAVPNRAFDANSFVRAHVAAC